MFSDLIRLTRNSISDFNYLSMFFICELRAFSDRIHITSTLLCVFNQRESMAKIKNETISPLHEKQMHKCMNCTYPYAQNGCKEKREKKTVQKKIHFAYPHFVQCYRINITYRHNTMESAGFLCYLVHKSNPSTVHRKKHTNQKKKN